MDDNHLEIACCIIAQGRCSIKIIACNIAQVQTIIKIVVSSIASGNNPIKITVCSIENTNNHIKIGVCRHAILRKQRILGVVKIYFQESGYFNSFLHGFWLIMSNQFYTGVFLKVKQKRAKYRNLVWEVHSLGPS